MKVPFYSFVILFFFVFADTVEGFSFPIEKLDFIGETIIPNDVLFEGTPVGGLSGMDYDAMSGRWVVISDDRSDYAPARAYIGYLPVTSDSVGVFEIVDLVKFKQEDGSLYPNRGEYKENHKGVVPDLESIRIDPLNGTLWYTSEGNSSLDLNPFICNALLDGAYVREWSLPEYYKLDSSRNGYGFYNNLALEGSSFTPDGAFYFAAMEAPLQQDGSLPTFERSADSRILKYDRDGKVIAEYVYRVDPLPAKPGVGKHGDNGISEILALDEHHLLVLERAGIQDDSGNYHNYIRIYQADLTAATNVVGCETLLKEQYQPMFKQLLLNLNDVPLELLDNVECMSFGPVLENGKRTLVLASDNNFYEKEVTQILVFTISTIDKNVYSR
jgi:hypothetical protein